MDEMTNNLIKEVKSAEKKSAPIRLCFVCEENKAEYYIKGEPEDAYCKECAEDAFGDVECLVKF